MRLHEHPDFAAFLTATAAELDLSEPFVEKDYWITEILRVIAGTLPDRAIFKGGTSLSKGWNLIDRFSEDIDLFVDPAIEPRLGKRAIDRTLKQLRADVEAIDGLRLTEHKMYGGFGRVDTFSYDSRYPAIVGFPRHRTPRARGAERQAADERRSDRLAGRRAARRAGGDGRTRSRRTRL